VGYNFHGIKDKLLRRIAMMGKKKSDNNAREVTNSAEKDNKEKGKIMNWITLIVAIFGAFGGLASIKMIVDHFTPVEIKGKIISQYNNITVKNETLFLYKLSILCQNKPFNLKKIKCEIKTPNGKVYQSVAINNRLIVFSNPQLFKNSEMLQRLTVRDAEFLNNLSYFPKDENITGYLFFRFNENLDVKLYSTTFIFESFDGKTKKLSIKEADVKQEDLFFDDSIWEEFKG
jgi:hypothetical protein